MVTSGRRAGRNGSPGSMIAKEMFAAFGTQPTNPSDQPVQGSRYFRACPVPVCRCHEGCAGELYARWCRGVPACSWVRTVDGLDRGGDWAVEVPAHRASRQLLNVTSVPTTGNGMEKVPHQRNACTKP